MLDLRLKLMEAEERGKNMTELMHVISQFPDLSTLTKLEKQLSGNMSLSNANFSTTFLVHEPVTIPVDVEGEFLDDTGIGSFTADGYCVTVPDKWGRYSRGRFSCAHFCSLRTTEQG
jgi:hypothetical protein